MVKCKKKRKYKLIIIIKIFHVLTSFTLLSRTLHSIIILGQFEFGKIFLKNANSRIVNNIKFINDSFVNNLMSWQSPAIYSPFF